MEFIPFFFKNNQTHCWNNPPHSFIKKTMRFLTVLAVLIVPPSLLFAAEAHLTWDPSLEADVAGYKVYVGIASQDYTESIDVGNTTSHTVSLFTPVVHYFAVTAYNADGEESDFSNEVSKDMANVPSASPSGGGGGGGCALRLSSAGEGNPLDAAEMLALIAAILFLRVKRALRPLPPSRIQQQRRGMRCRDRSE